MVGILVVEVLKCMIFQLLFLAIDVSDRKKAVLKSGCATMFARFVQGLCRCICEPVKCIVA